jgi:hypothetical protein
MDRLSIMSAQQILDTIERLLTAAHHPDIAGVDRYGPAGLNVAVTYASGAHAYVWAVPGRTVVKPVDLPENLGDYRPRVLHLIKLVCDLLEMARPDGMQWRTVAVDGVHLAPCGIEVRAGGETTLLQVNAGGAPGLDSDPAAWDGWRIPEAVRGA